MHGEEFVYAIIPDHISGDDRWDQILLKQDGKSHLERAIHAAVESRPQTGVDIVIVLSSNESVLDAATDLGAIANLVPSFFNTEVMLKTYFADPGIDIDPSEDPVIVVVDPYSLDFSEPRSMSEIVG